MDELDITWERALTVWWSISWRSGLFGFLAAITIGFVIGFFGTILHLNTSFLHRLSILLGIVAGAVIGIWAVKHVLKKRFRSFRILLVPLDLRGDKSSGATSAAPATAVQGPERPTDDFNI